MNITTGGVGLDEFEVFDMSNNGTGHLVFPRHQHYGDDL